MFLEPRECPARVKDWSPDRQGYSYIPVLSCPGIQLSRLPPSLPLCPACPANVRANVRAMKGAPNECHHPL
jgi:hypothetical protein